MDEKIDCKGPVVLPHTRKSRSLKQLLTTVVVIALLSLQIFAFCYAFNISIIQLSNSDNAVVPQSALPRDVIARAYLSTLQTNLASNWSRKYSGSKQLAGTNLAMVNWTRDQFEEFGLKATIDQYVSYVSYPESQSLSLVKSGKPVYQATLKEDYVKGDPDTKTFVPAFLGYAGSGNVTASYVFCNYGTHEDFDILDSLGIDLKGKVAVIRYGEIFRGLKVKFAQDRGASAVVLFTDPVDDGNITEANGYKTYPDGPARNPSSIQRGSVQFLSQLPGDPTTPGYAVKPGENKSRSDPYLSTPKIPVLPVSSREIAPILTKLNGYGSKVANWTKGLIEGFDYSTGPNPNYSINVYSKQNYTYTPMNNVLAKIEGHNSHEVIIIGNHHDSWTPSAGDPHSGSAVLLELARGLGQLAKIGWKPQRTILFASWDGEEYGLLGSTEYGEYYSDLLKKNTVAYINLDLAVAGSNLHLGSSPLLYDVLKDTAALLPYSDTQSLLQHYRSVSGGGHIANLGSGSDFTVFLDHLGIPSADLGFEGDLNSAVYQYHSIFDSFTWMEKYGDPGFKYHNLMSKYVGLLVLKLSETKVLPLRTRPYSMKLQEFFDKAVSEVPEEWLQSKVFNSSCPHHKNITVSNIVDNVKLKLGKLSSKTTAFDSGANGQQYDFDHWDDLSYWQKFKLEWAVKRTNFWLKFYERFFLREEGLKGRPWFKHIVFASGRYTGYSGQQLPAMLEAVEDGERDDFVDNLVYFDKVISRLIA
ncbi:DEKNAAC103460 [Brettanomyces naardenensis]|uniref:DEKNAAC103460 n=1 Tax=Brettanomyces naardenensis TaxID=13370 RepID=A0A448YNF0_BRENA|nr:DEKNAAC103460 [Brettanomyces naardenensis]